MNGNCYAILDADFTDKKDMCISGHNIQKLTTTTPENCAQECVDHGSACKGIEYFPVDVDTAYTAGDCILASSAIPNGCNNGYYKVDFYGKECGAEDCSCDVSFFCWCTSH